MNGALENANHATMEQNGTPVATLPIPAPRIDDKHAEAYSMKLAGRKPDEIANHFGVDRSTVYRWFEKYEAEFRKTLEDTPTFNLIADEIMRLNELENIARQHAASTKSDRQRVAYLNQALKAARARHELMLNVGVLPKEPEKLYRVTATMKPDDLQEKESTEPRSRDEAIAMLIEKARNMRNIE